MRGSTAPDDISVLERAYELRGTTEAWLDGLHDALKQRLDFGHGVSLSTWSVNDGRFGGDSINRGDIDPRLVAAQYEFASKVPPELINRYYGPAATDFIAQPSTFNPEISKELLRAIARHGVPGIVDTLGVVIMAAPGRSGMLLTSYASREISVSRPLRQLLMRLTTHIGAGLRLRTSLAQGQLPEAVLTPSGRVAYATGAAAEHGAREALTRAAKDIELSRGRLRRSSPDEALSLWKGLVAGRWSVVEWIDTDSRRYLVAHANQVSARDPRALSPRELDVAELIVQGRSNSEIAWSLGLGTGTVSRMSRDVLRKLGAARRTDLSAIFGAVAPFRAEHQNLVLLSPGSDTELWGRLTIAERAVVEALLQGQRPSMIAKKRGVSERTVTTQLSSVYARFGVRGRTELASLLGHAPKT
ncbi:MAG: helix-turn-helix transcriptional regulator [Archangium sp.]